MNIHMTRDDFDIITENGKHLNQEAEFNRKNFQDMMRGMYVYTRNPPTHPHTHSCVCVCVCVCVRVFVYSTYLAICAHHIYIYIHTESILKT
jgi:hypothetical protein